MAIRVEVLKVTESDGRVAASIALYFAVPLAQQSALAVDPARTPAGMKLSPAEIQDLKDGKIIEELRGIDITGLSVPQLRAAITDVWQERRPIALAAYANTKRLVGDTWTDAPAWVNA